LITSQIRSRIEFLIPADNILVYLYAQMMKNLPLLTVFNGVLQVAYYLSHSVYNYRVAQKSKPLPNDQKIVLNRI